MFCPKRLDRVPSSYFLSSPGVDVDGRHISSKREKGVLTCKSDCGWEEGKGLWNWMEMSPSPPRISLQKMIDCFLRIFGAHCADAGGTGSSEHSVLPVESRPIQLRKIGSMCRRDGHLTGRVPTAPAGDRNVTMIMASMTVTPALWRAIPPVAESPETPGDSLFSPPPRWARR